MLDRYWFGEVERISPEAPVPVVRVRDTQERLGGLAHITRMIELARAAGRRVLVDPKGDDYARYAGATVITPNRAELREVVGRWKSEADLEGRVQKMRRDLGIDAVLLTRSEEGM